MASPLKGAIAKAMGKAMKAMTFPVTYRKTTGTTAMKTALICCRTRPTVFPSWSVMEFRVPKTRTGLPKPPVARPWPRLRMARGSAPNEDSSAQ